MKNLFSTLTYIFSILFLFFILQFGVTISILFHTLMIVSIVLVVLARNNYIHIKNIQILGFVPLMIHILLIVIYLSFSIVSLAMHTLLLSIYGYFIFIENKKHVKIQVLRSLVFVFIALIFVDFMFGWFTLYYLLLLGGALASAMLTVYFTSDVYFQHIDIPRSNNQHNQETSISTHIILSILTLGIYYIYWMYTIGDHINKEAKSPNASGVEIILCYIVPFYRLYWMYQKEKLQLELHHDKQDNRTLYLLLQVFGLEIIATAIMQSEINQYSQGYGYQYTSVNERDVYEKLRKLSQLVQEGIITQEDFEDKKTELLQRI